MAADTAGGFELLPALGHDIKGTGASYGFPALTQMGAALEHSARQLDAGTLSKQLTELGDYLSRVQLFPIL